MAEDNKQFWTTNELAREAKVSSAYIRQLLLEGKLEGHKQGRDWIILDRDAREWLEKREAKKND